MVVMGEEDLVVGVEVEGVVSEAEEEEGSEAIGSDSLLAFYEWGVGWIFEKILYYEVKHDDSAGFWEDNS